MSVNEWADRLPALAALWLGILTSISPCPLATNIAAVSFIGKTVSSPSRALVLGLLYTLGRVLAYTILGVLLVKGVLTAFGTGNFLQKYMNILLGPVLIVVGVFLMGCIRINLGGGISGERAQSWAAKAGAFGPVLLGILFALSFCPISAGLFFLSLVPLAAKHASPVLFPVLYGIGTGLPVLGFAAVVALGTAAVAKAYNRISHFEWWAQRITGVIFIVVGVYYVVNLFRFGLVG